MQDKRNLQKALQVSIRTPVKGVIYIEFRDSIYPVFQSAPP